MTPSNPYPAKVVRGAPRGCAQQPVGLRPSLHLRALWRTLLLLLLLFASTYATAARVCYNVANQSIEGVGITTAGTCNQLADNAMSNTVLRLNPGRVPNTSQSCTINFSAPVKNVTVDIGVHTCVTDACERATFEINGAPRAIQGPELTTPTSDLNNFSDFGATTAISIDANGGLVGGPFNDDFYGNGAGKVSFSEASVSSIKIIETTVVPEGLPVNSFDPAGTWFQVCYDGLVAAAPTLKVSKVTTGGTGNFSFKGSATNANGFSTDNTYTVTTTAAGAVATGSAVTLNAANTVTEIQETVPPGWVLTGASCVDNNAATTGNLQGTFGVLNNNTLQLPAATVLAGADLQCTFHNTFVGLAVSGKVILDTGVGSGTAHDAIQNGAEKAHSGVSVSLTNCAGTTYSTTTSAGDGSFNLSLVGVPAAQAVCVVQTLPAGYSPVSVNTGSTTAALTTTTANSTTVRFTPTANTAYSGIVLGNAPVSTLTSDGAQQTSAGQTVTYAHIYTAGSAGSVTFTTASNSTPLGQPWASTLHLDANCSGTLDAGDTALSTALSVTAGQQVCVINRVFAPAGVGSGAQDITVLSATQTWSTATLTPTSQSSTLKNTDVTRISSVGLNLIKEVRQLSSCPTTAASSQALTTPYGATSSAKPGDALEYRLRYSNNSAAPINSVKLYDAIPAYTQFKSAFCLSTPTQGIGGCAVTQQPGLNATTGSIAWTLTDTPGPYGGLQPSDSGSVGFCITVQTQ
jgi:uncharacterized repeat protein (TIGR01451 family)